MSSDQNPSETQASVPPVSGTTGTLNLWAVGIAVVVLFAAIWLVGNYAADAKTAGTDAAATLALIAAVAVGIERVIASGWALLDQTNKAWWPFRQMGVEVSELLTTLDAQLQPIYTESAKVLEAATGIGGASAKGIESAMKELDAIKTRIQNLQKTAPNSQRLNLIAASASQALGYAEQVDRDHNLTLNIQLTNQAIAGLTDFVGSFRENPGRRLISIYVGALLGLGVAWALRLDLFLAVFDRPANSGGLLPYLGVVLTGLVIGLGSNPTHEVIGVLQEIKKQRAAQNQPGPIAGGTIVVETEGPAAEAARSFGAVEPELADEATPREAPQAARQRTSYPPIRRFR